MDPFAEVEEGSGVVGDAVVGPLEEMELLHFSDWHLNTALAGKLWPRE